MKKELSNKKVTVMGHFSYQNNSDGIPKGKAYCTECYDNNESLNSFIVKGVIAECHVCNYVAMAHESQKNMNLIEFNKFKKSHSERI